MKLRQTNSLKSTSRPSRSRRQRKSQLLLQKRRMMTILAISEMLGLMRSHSSNLKSLRSNLLLHQKMLTIRMTILSLVTLTMLRLSHSRRRHNRSSLIKSKMTTKKMKMMILEILAKPRPKAMNSQKLKRMPRVAIHTM